MNTAERFEQVVYGKPPRAEREIPNRCFWILDEVIHSSAEGFACVIFAFAWHAEFFDVILNALAIRYAKDGEGLELVVLQSKDPPSVAGRYSGCEWILRPQGWRERWIADWATRNPHHLARGAALAGIYYGTWNGITHACSTLRALREL